MNDLIPEIHDILKLCKSVRFSYSGKRGSPHSNTFGVLEEARIKGFDLSTIPSWFGVLKHHHGWNAKLYPDSPELFLLDMADSLAAALSRGDNHLRLGLHRPYKQYGFDDQVFKLWRNQPGDRQRNRTIRPLELEQVFAFLSENPTVEKFYEFVGDAIYQRSEDATMGANLTSLYTHLILTGKFYRLLDKASYRVTKNDLGDRKYKIQNLYKTKLCEWNLIVSRIKLLFPQKPIRTKDMNVFERLKEVRRRIEADFRDNIFFNTLMKFSL